MRVRMMLLVGVALAVGFAPAPFPRASKREADRNRTDLQRMQGLWNLKSYKQDGQEMPSKSGRWQVVIVGDRLMHLVDGHTRSEWIIRLDASNSPPAIDTREVKRTEAWPGIYRLSGNTLIICENRPGARRPTSFDTGKLTVSVLERTTP